MKITDKKIDELAHLARLEFQGDKKVKIKEDLEKILGFCEQLNSVNTDGIEPLIYLSDATNKLREDKVITDITKSEALKNAPKKDSDFFRVPKVITK
jgi:aspartyl-tRNA(Asn)/glutamyl-tRNA(Gln) amidotransferase subunit C